MSSRHHRSASSYYDETPASSSTRHSRRGSPGEENDDLRSPARYKELYKECKHELKRKKRQVEELESGLDKEGKEAKKAKQDTQDLWKIYYTLQQELQQSYERNAKLSAEKAVLEAEVDKLRKNIEARTAGGESDPNKLKQALMTMQKQKLDIQKTYNNIVLENKKLKEKEATYEPRLRELASVRQKLQAAQEGAQEIAGEVHELKGEFARFGHTKEEVEKYQRWNGLLMMEANEKSQKLHHLTPMESRVEALWTEQEHLRDALAQTYQKQAEHRLEDRDKLAKSHGAMKAVGYQLAQLKMESSWCFNAIRDYLAKMERFLAETRRDLMARIPDSATKMAESGTGVVLIREKEDEVNGKGLVVPNFVDEEEESKGKEKEEVVTLDDGDEQPADIVIFDST